MNLRNNSLATAILFGSISYANATSIPLPLGASYNPETNELIMFNETITPKAFQIIDNGYYIEIDSSSSPQGLTTQEFEHGKVEITQKGHDVNVISSLTGANFQSATKLKFTLVDSEARLDKIEDIAELSKSIDVSNTANFNAPIDDPSLAKYRDFGCGMTGETVIQSSLTYHGRLYELDKSDLDLDNIASKLDHLTVSTVLTEPDIGSIGLKVTYESDELNLGSTYQSHCDSYPKNSFMEEISKARMASGMLSGMIYKDAPTLSTLVGEIGDYLISIFNAPDKTHSMEFKINVKEASREAKKIIEGISSSASSNMEVKITHSEQSKGLGDSTTTDKNDQ